MSEKIAGQYPVNYIYVCDGYLSISLDCSVRLGSRLVCALIISICFIGLQQDHPENPYGKDWVDHVVARIRKIDRFHA